MNAQDLGRLVLRITVGGLMLFHGINKAMHGVGGITDSVVKHGLPSFVAYGVLIGEIVAPLMIVLGLWTRIGALVLAFNMAVAVWLSHTGDLFKLKSSGSYALEIQAFYFAGALVIAMLGGGRFCAVKNRFS
jgi:putative oxidoreductase